VRELADLFRDAKRAVQHLAYGISECASQSYDALPFIPSKTLLESKPIQVLSGMEERWSTCLRTIYNGDWLSMMACSPDSTIIAGSTVQQSLGIIKLWDARTGEIVAQSDPYGSEPPVFAFLPNGWIIIGSKDGSLRIWDVEGSKITHSLWGHTDVIFSVSVSPTGSRFASASNKAVYI
jgi:WD40 repeat protein